MQSVSSRFWTRVAVYNSYDDNHYSTCNLEDGLLHIDVLVLADLQRCISALCRHQMQPRRSGKSDGWLGWVVRESQGPLCFQHETVETQRLYLLRHRCRRAIKDGFFGLINPYQVFHSRVHTEFLSLYSSRWALSEDSGFKSYPSQPEVYLVKNVVR